MEYTTPVYFGIALSLLFFFSNCGNYFTGRKYGLSVVKSEMLFALGFNFFKAKRNGVDFRLGWLPLGSYLKHNVEDDEEMKIAMRKLHKKNILLNLIVFAVLVLLIDFSFDSFSRVLGFYKSCFELALGNLPYDEFIKPFSGQTYTVSYFIYVLAILSLLPIAATITTLLETTVFKYLSLLFALAFCITYFIVMYKIAGHSTDMIWVVFYIACLLSAFILTLISMLIIKRN